MDNAENVLRAITVLFESRLSPEDRIHYSDFSDQGDTVTQTTAFNFDEEEVGGGVLKPSASLNYILSEKCLILTEVQSTTDLRVSRPALESVLQLPKLDDVSEMCNTEIDFNPNDLGSPRNIDETEANMNISDGETTRYTQMATYRDGLEKDGPQIDVAE